MTRTRNWRLLLGLVFIAFGVCALAADNGFKFADPTLQAKFVAALRNEGIPFQAQPDGAVTYDAGMEEKVRKLRLAVLQQSFTPAYHFVDPTLEEEFTNRLRGAEISFGLETKNGERYITWSPQDDERVKKIREDVLNAIHR